MNPPNHPKLQHYVPRFLLKEFTSGKKRRLFAYDKHTDKVFQTTPEKVAAENGFYDFRLQGVALTAEPAMGSLESAAAPAIKRVVREESLASLTDQERHVLSLFVAVQQSRTRNFRDSMAQMNAQVLEWLEGFGADVEHLRLSEDELAAEAVRFALDAHSVAPLIYDKAWVLLKNSTATPFYTSDNPVALQNLNDFGPYGNLGLGVPGIEIYLPLSRSLCLCMICRTREQEGRDVAQKYAALRRSVGFLPPDVERRLSGVREMLRAIDDGVPLPQSRDNVTNANSLQVKYAARYVYSATDDFALVRQMLADQPGWRTGPRIEVGGAGRQPRS